MPSQTFFFVVLIITSITANATEVRIAVSDLIADRISGTIQTLATSHSIQASVIKTGSLPALYALRADEIPLAIVVAPEKSDYAKLPEGTFNTFTIAYTTAIIAVNKSNPINEVSLDDLRGVFSFSADPDIETWDLLGVSSLAGRSIKPLTIHSTESISKELFRQTVLQGDSMKLSVNELAASEAEEMLLNNIASIAVLPHLPDNKAIKALMISSDAESPAFGPADENIYYGDYPIRLPFQIVYKAEDEPELSEVLRILLSDQLNKVLKENHLFVPPDAIRESFIERLDF